VRARGEFYIHVSGAAHLNWTSLIAWMGRPGRRSLFRPRTIEEEGRHACTERWQACETCKNEKYELEGDRQRGMWNGQGRVFRTEKEKCRKNERQTDETDPKRHGRFSFERDCSVLQCSAVCCSVLQWLAMKKRKKRDTVVSLPHENVQEKHRDKRAFSLHNTSSQ